MELLPQALLHFGARHGNSDLFDSKGVHALQEECHLVLPPVYLAIDRGLGLSVSDVSQLGRQDFVADSAARQFHLEQLCGLVFPINHVSSVVFLPL